MENSISDLPHFGDMRAQNTLTLTIMEKITDYINSVKMTPQQARMGNFNDVETIPIKAVIKVVDMVLEQVKSEIPDDMPLHLKAELKRRLINLSLIPDCTGNGLAL